MKKLVVLLLVLGAVLSMTGCGCDHQWEYATCQAPKTCTECGETEGTALAHVPGDEVIGAVDTAGLTVTYEIPCSGCGQVMESRTGSAGAAPVAGVIALSGEEWYQCLLTVIQNYGAGQSLYSYPVENEENTMLRSLVTMSQMNAVFSFQDSEGTVLTTDQQDARGMIHNIRVDAQFNNDNAKEFYMLLMLLAINNNSSLEPEAANTLAGQIMSGNPVTDNGYTYAMEIASVEDHRVCVSITAE